MGVYFHIRRFLRRRLLRSLQPCREMVPLMSESLERQLSVLERLKLKLHFIVCAWCVCYLKQITIIRATLRAQPQDSNLPTLSPSARERLRHTLKNTNHS